jgi:hypothetical protein
LFLAFLCCKKDLLLISNLEMDTQNNKLIGALRRKVMGIRLG